MINWGDKEDFLWDVYAQRNIEPEALANKPALPGYLMMYVDAYSLLSAQREYGLDGVQPLSIQSILSIATEYDVYDREVFIKHICSMDRAHRKLLDSKKETIKVKPSG